MTRLGRHCRIQSLRGTVSSLYCEWESMKISVINDEVSQNLDEVIRLAKEFGLAGIELRSVFGHAPEHFTIELLNDVHATLQRTSTAIAGYAPPTFKVPLPISDSEYRSAADQLNVYESHAATLSAPHLRIFSFLRTGDPNPREAARVLGQILGTRRGDVPLLVETGTRTNTPTLRHALDLLDELGNESIGILWDPGNSLFSGYETTSLPDAYWSARGYIRHIHVKDPLDSRRYTRLGDGMLDWPQILHRLATDDYTGFLSLETHWRRGKVLTSAERHAPHGHGFSEGGEIATRECLSRLTSWISQLTT